jgi:hypothetical protein
VPGSRKAETPVRRWWHGWLAVVCMVRFMFRAGHWHNEGHFAPAWASIRGDCTYCRLCLLCTECDSPAPRDAVRL